MNLYVGKYNVEPVQQDVEKTSVTFKGNNKVLVELSDDIFKIASTAITAAGIAALGIQANKGLRKKNIEDAVIVQENKNLITRAELARRLGVNLHSIEWHLKEHIVMNEDNLIDLDNMFNKRFVETFKKGTRYNETLFTPDKYERLQTVLGKKLPVDYCLKYGLLIADENGLIDTLQEPNKTFVEKIKNKELTYKNFFMSVEQYAGYLSVHPISINRAIKRGAIIFNEDKRIDINQPENKAFEEKVRLAQKRAEDKGLKRTTSFVHVPDDSKTKLTQSEFAQKVGYKTMQGLAQHIKNGRVVIDKDGFIDITAEPNKSFMESRLNGTYVPQPDMYSRSKTGKKEVNPNEVSRLKFSTMAGIAPSTLRHHIEKGHVVLNEKDKIDITNETNKYFLDNHKKGVALYPNTTVKPPKEPVVQEPEVKNPNIICLKDLGYISGLTLWPLIQHVNRGRIIREKDGVDVTNPVNKYFINKYEENGIEKLDKMTLSDLGKLKQRIENRYKNLIPRSIYIQAKEAKDKSDFDNFIKNTTYALFRVEVLSPKEMEFIENMVSDIIQTRLEDSNKPADFSDIKDFYLTGVIELEPELNIIDKLITKYGVSSNEDYTKFLNKIKSGTCDFSRLNIKNITQKAKSFGKKEFEKLMAWLKKKGSTEVDVDSMSINDLKLKMLELTDAKNIKENKQIIQMIEFLYVYEVINEAEQEVIKSFVKELIKYNDSNGAEEFSKDILEKVQELEDNYNKNEQRKQAVFDRVNTRLNDSISLLYSKGLNNAAEICYGYIPDSPNDIEQINKAQRIIELAFSLNEDVFLPDKFKNKPKEEQEIELERLKNKKPQEIEDKIVGFDMEDSNSSMLTEAKTFAMARYGEIKPQYLGEYARLVNNLELKDFSSYPKFCKDLYGKLSSLKKDEAVMILSKLDEWSYLAKSEKKKYRNLSNLFSKEIPLEMEILTEYIEKDYINYDTVITAVNISDAKTRIPATLSIKAKMQMLKQVKLNELPDYLSAFETSMTKIVPDGNGIKEHRTKNHEVRISYPARLYSPNIDFYFDEFEYHAHQGSKT